MRRHTAAPALVCPACGDRFEGHMAIGNAALKKMRAPIPGSFLICFNCGEISLMGKAGTARRLSEEEAMDLPPDFIQLLATCEEARQATMRDLARNPFGRNL